MEHAEANAGAGTGSKVSVVPKVHLHATSERALDVVGMEKLKK